MPAKTRSKTRPSVSLETLPRTLEELTCVEAAAAQGGQWGLGRAAASGARKYVNLREFINNHLRHDDH